MDGPTHYREAERLADRANYYTYGDGGDPTIGAALAAEAQVHATLALAAATALNDHGDGSINGGGMPVADWDAWKDTASVRPGGHQ